MRAKKRTTAVSLTARVAVLPALLLILTSSCNSPGAVLPSPSPSASSPQSGSAVNLPPTPATAWQQVPGGFQLSYTLAPHAVLLLLSPPATDAHTGDVFALFEGPNLGLGRWHGGQWSFSPPPVPFSSMAYDPARQQLIAVSPGTAGGAAVSIAGGAAVSTADSWGWDGSTWQKLSLGVAVAFGGFPGDSLFYDASTQSLELVSISASEGFEAYARSELGPQGNWQVIECGSGFWTESQPTVESCGLPTKNGVPTPFPWVFSGSPDAPPPAITNSPLGYDPRLRAVIGYQPLTNSTVRLLEFSSGIWQPIGAAAPSLPYGSWAGAYDSVDQTLWISGHTADGAFHLYSDDSANGFRTVTLTQTPPAPAAAASPPSARRPTNYWRTQSCPNFGTGASHTIPLANSCSGSTMATRIGRLGLSPTAVWGLRSLY